MISTMKTSTRQLTLDPYGIFIDLMLVYIYTTLFQSVVDRVSFNRIIGAVLTIDVAFICLHRLGKWQIIAFNVLIISFFSALFVTLDLPQEVLEWIYLITTLFILFLLSNHKSMEHLTKRIKERKRFLRFVVWSSCLILSVLLVGRVGYEQKWDGEAYFLGFCQGSHTMASLCCLVLSVTLLYCRLFPCNRKLYFFLALIPSYAIFETGARVFLIPVGIIMFFFIRTISAKFISRLISYLIGAIAFVWALFNSTMMEKILFALNNPYASDFLSSFTSDRSIFWVIDLRYFLDGNFLQLLFGRSFSHVYAINLSETGMKIWAHNDIIHLLIGTGLSGTLIYIISFFSMAKHAKVTIHSKMALTMLIVYILFPLLFNGFFSYQHLVYSFVMMSLFLYRAPKGSV